MLHGDLDSCPRCSLPHGPVRQKAQLAGRQHSHSRDSGICFHRWARWVRPQHHDTIFATIYRPALRAAGAGSENHKKTFLTNPISPPQSPLGPGTSRYGVDDPPHSPRVRTLPSCHADWREASGSESNFFSKKIKLNRMKAVGLVCSSAHGRFVTPCGRMSLSPPRQSPLAPLSGCFVFPRACHQLQNLRLEAGQPELNFV